MSEEQPHWYISRQPNTNWNEADAARFDSPPFAAHYKMGVDHPNYTPPLDPQQPTPEQIADAARLAADDIALVFRIWPYSNLAPLGSLRMLHLLLTPPAPKWTAKEEE